MYDELNLGDRAKHVISGFEGIVTAKVEYLQGCEQICLTPRGVHKETGQPLESCYFDAPYVDLVARNVVPVRDVGGMQHEREDNDGVVELPRQRQEGPGKAPGRTSNAQPPVRN